jgi:DNA-binding NarL/FixJ family response regulator
MAILLPALQPPAAPSAYVIAEPICPSCRSTARRLRELEQANQLLQHEVELGAQRLQAALAQLALAQAGSAPGAAGCDHAAPVAPAQRLAARERQVLCLITEGQRTPSIAGRLGITSATVEVHRRNIMRKLGLHSVAQLTRYALREGIASL